MKVFYALALYTAILIVSFILLIERMSRGADLLRLYLVMSAVFLVCAVVIGVVIQRRMSRS